jgi:hypothetical protein
MRRLLLVGTAAVALLAPSAHATPGQLPVGLSGWATGNVRPVAHVNTLGAGVGGAFYGSKTYVQSVADELWNYTNAPTTVTGGLQVFDVSTPEKPRLEGQLPLPNYQNEDVQVSTSRHVAVMSQDITGRVTLVDLTDPTLPTILGTVALPLGYGHTSSLVDHDRYLWTSGGPEVLVVDLRDLHAPKVVGTFPTPAGARGPSGYTGVHDADADQYGDISVYGSGGTAVYDLTSDPLKPRLVAQIATRDNTLVRDGLIHHGGKRLDRDTWVLTEEDYSQGCKDDGALEVWRLDRRAKLLRFVSMWDAPTGSDEGRGAAAQTYCSSHWFDINRDHVVADGWYEAGARFLDLSDPRHPRPIGTWAGDSTTASQALFFPGRDDLVYVADYVRGLDVVSLAHGGRGARTAKPSDEKRVGTSTAPGLTFTVKLTPHQHFGWSCLTPAVRHRSRVG